MKRSDIITDAMEAEENWRDYLNSCILPSQKRFSNSSLKEFYNVLSFNYAMKVGYTEDTTYRLTVFEILQGGNFSPEYILLNDVMPIEFLYHYAVFLMETAPEKITDRCRQSLQKVDVHKIFTKNNKILRTLWMKDSEFVERMILTRVISSYETYFGLAESAKESLEAIDSDRAYYRSIGKDPKEMGIDEVEATIKKNINSYELIVNLIEILFDSGVKVYSPSELNGFVKAYLSNLVKKNEEMLNPFVKSERKDDVLAGELKIQAFMESQTGKDWVLPR